MSGFTEADVSDQSGKCFIVTGANTGVGFEASRVLAARGARVLLACRDKAKAEAAMARIGRLAPGATLAFLPLDQADLGSRLEARPDGLPVDAAVAGLGDPGLPRGEHPRAPFRVERDDPVAAAVVVLLGEFVVVLLGGLVVRRHARRLPLPKCAGEP